MIGRCWCRLMGCDQKPCVVFAAPATRATFCRRCKTLRLIDFAGAAGEAIEFEIEWNEGDRGSVVKAPVVTIRRVQGAVTLEDGGKDADSYKLNPGGQRA